VVHALIPAFGRLRQEDLEFKANLGYKDHVSEERKKEKDLKRHFLKDIQIVK
jgi:hypothetical protein